MFLAHHTFYGLFFNFKLLDILDIGENLLRNKECCGGGYLLLLVIGRLMGPS